VNKLVNVQFMPIYSIFNKKFNYSPVRMCKVDMCGKRRFARKLSYAFRLISADW